MTTAPTLEERLTTAPWGIDWRETLSQEGPDDAGQDVSRAPRGERRVLERRDRHAPEEPRLTTEDRSQRGGRAHGRNWRQTE